MLVIDLAPHCVGETKGLEDCTRHECQGGRVSSVTAIDGGDGHAKTVEVGLSGRVASDRP